MDISRVKFNLGRKVIYDDTEYLLTACTIRPSEHGFFYQAELQDTSASSSVIITSLSKINEKKEPEND